MDECKIVWPESPLNGMACAPKTLAGDAAPVRGEQLYQLLESRGHHYRKGDYLWLAPERIEITARGPRASAGEAKPALSLPALSFTHAGAVVPSGGAGPFLVPVSEGVEGPTVLDQVRA
jgi:hypothetical protein